MPLPTIQPETSDRATAVISGTPCSDTVSNVASGDLNISAYSVAEARLPTVSSGLGTRATLVPSLSKIEIVQSGLGRCRSKMP